VVLTNTEKVRKTVSGVLEFLLINHPLDCPVCDQAGECFLQSYYMKFGLYDSRFNENKIKRQQAQPIGPHVILDNERCILCSRCVRFVREVTKTNELAIFSRGSESEIGLLPGQELDNNYSGNVVDICPVGALTDRDFRFQCRVWYLHSTASICPGCSRGCNIDIHSNQERAHHAENHRVVRLKPRFNASVNQWWICDEGRYGYKSIDAPSRIVAAEIQQDGERHLIGWDEAIQTAARQIQTALESRGRDSLSILASPQLTNEDLFIIWKLFCEQLGISPIGFYVPNATPAQGDALLLRADRTPNTLGAEIIFRGCPWVFPGKINPATPPPFAVLYLFEHDLVKETGRAQAEAFLAQFEQVIYQGSQHNATSDRAHLVLPAAAYAEVEGTFTNFAGRVQKINSALSPLGNALPHWQILMKLAHQMGMGFSYATAAELFAALAGTVAEFQGLSYQLIGDQGKEIALGKANLK
jgi:NADH-quinone oxidoreductase subunit G